MGSVFSKKKEPKPEKAKITKQDEEVLVSKSRFHVCRVCAKFVQHALKSAFVTFETMIIKQLYSRRAKHNSNFN